jgi:type II secretory pathway pseudopilin PulG
MEDRNQRRSEAGFTLVEALTAIVVLVFGLMAITNLMLVAASSNSVANQSTAATNSASRILDMVRATGYNALPTGGDVDAVFSASVGLCATTTIDTFQCREDVPGVGMIYTRWTIGKVAGSKDRLTFIRVRSEGTGALSAGRSRAEFTTFRSCTDTETPPGCPLP